MAIRNRALHLIALAFILFPLVGAGIDDRTIETAAQSHAGPSRSAVQPATSEEMLRDMLAHD